MHVKRFTVDQARSPSPRCDSELPCAARCRPGPFKNTSNDMHYFDAVIGLVRHRTVGSLRPVL